MSYSGWSDSNNISHGSGSDIDDLDAATYCFWWYSSFSNARGCAAWKENMFFNLDFRGSSDIIQIAKTTTGTATSAYGSLATWTYGVQNAWIFVAGSYKTGGSGGAAGDNRICIGDLSHYCVDDGTYDSQSAGTGNATGDAAQNLIIGDHAGASSRSFVGQIAFLALFNDVLTDAERQAVQAYTRGRSRYLPKRSNLMLMCWYGQASQGTTVDLSGNARTCTINGTLTNDVNPPLKRMWELIHTVHPSQTAAPPATGTVPRLMLLGVG